MDNIRQRRNRMRKRISEETSDTEESSNISTAKEKRQESDLFTITDVRSLSEQNKDHDDLVPTNQKLDVSSPTEPDPFYDYQSFVTSQFRHPLLPCIYTGKFADQSIQPSTYVPLYWPVDLTFDYMPCRNISASVKEGPMSRSTQGKPDIVLDDISNSFRSNKIDEQEKDIETVGNINDELIAFEERLTNHFRKMPLRSALLLQNEIQGIITSERLKCLDEQ